MAGRQCYHCKQWIDQGEAHDCWTTTEAALTEDLSEDLRDAWERLRETAVSFGDQRVYASHKSIMFARKSCYFFVRPKKSFLEVCVFLGRAVNAPQVRRVDSASKSKFVHFVRITHRDEVEPPITDWLREAYELNDVLAPQAVPGRSTAAPKSVITRTSTNAMAAKHTKKQVAVAASVDEYLARLDEPERTALAKLRAQIRQAAPKAAELISYQIPTYRLHGPLVHFAAQPKHLSFTVVSLGAIDAFREELRDFDIAGRTIRFLAKKPLPAALVKRIVRMRVAENEARARTRPGGFAPPDPHPTPARTDRAPGAPGAPSLAGPRRPAPLRRARLRRA